MNFRQIPHLHRPPSDGYQRRLAIGALPKLRSPFWRLVTLTAIGLPGLIAVAVTQCGWAFPFPPTCLFQWMFGFPSPSCGLTRAVLALAEGKWQLALSYHLFAPVIVAIAIAVAIATLLELLTRRSFATLYARSLQYSGTKGLLILALVYYGLRLWARYMQPTLPWGLNELALWQQFVAGAIAL